MHWNPSDLETVPCDFCGSASARHIFMRPDEMAVVECDQCALAFLNPRPKPGLVARLYDAAYFNKPTASASIGYANYFSQKNRLLMLRVSQTRYDVFSQFMSGKPMRTLEVGCGTGEFCSLLHQAGHNALGLDLSGEAIGLARERYPGIDFRQGDLMELEHSVNFDAVFGFELIEHLLSPGSFIEAVRDHLTPGGLLALTTPNLDCGKAIGFENWMGFSSSFEHLYFFSQQMLSKYANRAGFERMVWLTGEGRGYSADSEPPSRARTLAKQALALTGLLEPARRTRARFRRDTESSSGANANDYRVGGNAHNLYIVFRKLDR